MLRVKEGIAVLRSDLKAGHFVMADKAVMRVPAIEDYPSLTKVLRKVTEDDEADLPRLTVWMEDEDGEHIIMTDRNRVRYVCPRRNTELFLQDGAIGEMAFTLVEHARQHEQVFLHYFIGERVVMQAGLVAKKDAVPYWEVLSLNAEPVELMYLMEMLKKLDLEYETSYAKLEEYEMAKAVKSAPCADGCCPVELNDSGITPKPRFDESLGQMLQN